TVDFGANDGAEGVAVDSAGRLVLVGTTIDNQANASKFAIARLTGETATAKVQVNDGAAQRSMVTSFAVTFSEPVTFPNGIESAFQLQRTGPGSPAGNVTLALDQSGATVNVSFNDPTFAPGIAKSLIDGRYTLTLIASQIQSASGSLDGDADGVAGGDLV